MTLTVPSDSTRIQPPICACVNPKCDLTTRRTRRGRCPRCDSYFRRNGVERDPERLKYMRIASYPTTCSNTACGNIILKARQLRRGRCFCCYGYFRRNGIERSFDVFYDERPPCTNCKAELTKGKCFKGRCRSCYAYWRRTGKDIQPDMMRSRRKEGACPPTRK